MKGESIYERFERAINILVTSFTVMGCSIIVGMMTLIFIDVIGRYLFNKPLPSVYEISEELLMVAIVFFGLAGAHHVRLTLVTSRFPQKVRNIFALIVLSISISFFGLMAWQTGEQAALSVATRELSEAYVTFPIYPARIVVVMGIALLILVMIVAFFKIALGGKRSEWVE